ncbi:MAG: hypothetical protein IBX36_00740 [Dehalococcoidia bacterium]|nr:hypothetical protein [Dehalococcoidia bacterium]
MLTRGHIGKAWGSHIQKETLFVRNVTYVSIVKAHRDNVTSLITLFTFNRKAWVMQPLAAIRAYGTPDQNGRLGLYFTMSQQPNSSGLFLTVTDEVVSVQHTSGKTLARWFTKDLSVQFQAKMPALILVTARTEMRGDVEYFNYYRARLLTGSSPTLVADQIRRGTILIDLRLHDAITHARNHGTGFRAGEASLDQLFTKVETL